MFGEFMQHHGEAIGGVRWWSDVVLLDQKIMVAKMNLGPKLVALETDNIPA